jgi:hypothetical protein
VAEDVQLQLGRASRGDGSPMPVARADGSPAWPQRRKYVVAGEGKLRGTARTWRAHDKTSLV